MHCIFLYYMPSNLILFKDLGYLRGWGHSDLSEDWVHHSKQVFNHRNHALIWLSHRAALFVLEVRYKCLFTES